jgi:hypothetical protein
MIPSETSALIRHSLIISPVCSSHTLFTYARPGLFEVVEEVRFYFQVFRRLRTRA